MKKNHLKVLTLSLLLMVAAILPINANTSLSTLEISGKSSVDMVEDISFQSQDEAGTPMYVKVSIFNLIGIKISPCLSFGLANIEVYQEFGNGQALIHDYLCPEDISEELYVNPGDKIVVTAEILSTGLKYRKEMVLSEADIYSGGILDVSLTIDITL